MALRNIRTDEDPALRKKAKEIDKVSDRIKQLQEDMLETMYDAQGVGLAANQIGVLRRIVVIDIGEGPITLINPTIIEEKGEQIEREGCLSVPGKTGCVKRPNYVKVSYTDIDGKDQITEGEELLAIAICHELDHLDGILFTDKLVPCVEEEEGA
ncbi:MAG TPA: peptide deformylase [Eubacteriaceae bacterium]|nr:peptide deformylase [Eubacteriaceae bacterium]